MSDEPKDMESAERPESRGSMWGARFGSVMAPEMVELNRSLPVDSCLWREDIRASKAWAQALGRAGVLTSNELGLIVDA